jgi:NADH dehydrogenase FAD-containing subunit
MLKQISTALVSAGVMKGLRVVSYDGSIVRLSDGTSLPAATLIWTAGVQPPEIIKSLPLQKIEVVCA